MMASAESIRELAYGARVGAGIGMQWDGLKRFMEVGKW
jgi:hypothetical protein